MKFSHLNTKGDIKMVDVSQKKTTSRRAVAEAEVLLKSSTLKMIQEFNISKGNVLTTAKIAGISAAKKTSDLIPLCHPLLIESVDIVFSFGSGHCIALKKTTRDCRFSAEQIAEKSKIKIRSIVILEGKTGAEMEALTAVTVAALTIYDMCKSVDKEMVVSNIRLLRKSGGKSGKYIRRKK